MTSLIAQLSEQDASSIRLQAIGIIVITFIAPVVVLFCIRLILKLFINRIKEESSNKLVLGTRWIFLGNFFYILASLALCLGIFIFLMIVKPVFFGAKDFPISGNQLVLRDKVFYHFITNSPYSGDFYFNHNNGRKALQRSLKNGKYEGLKISWHENGKKMSESNWNKGEQIDGSEKYWNSKGEPVDSLEEAKSR